MSCEWHLHCPKCKCESECGLNHGRDPLLQLIADAPVLLAAMACKSWDWPLVMMPSFGGRNEYLTFLQEHHDHGIVPIDEYGRFEE